MYLYQLTHFLTRQVKVTSTLAGYLGRQGIVSIQELLETYPTRYQDRVTISDFPLFHPEGGSLWLTQRARVAAHESFFSKGQPVLKIRFTNQAGQTGVLLCFNRHFLAKTLYEGVEFYVYGSFSFSYGEWSTGSFDFERITKDPPKRFGSLFPLYRGQTQPTPAYRILIEKILTLYEPLLEDDVPQDLVESEGLTTLANALRECHLPTSLVTLEQARRTLVVREIFWLQAELAFRAKFFATRRPARDLSRDWQEKVEQSLPFTLTGDQRRAIEEITQDLSAPVTMNRLLQGDVGTGKTLVAFLSALPLLQVGEQVAFMAPTELLARQHWNTFGQLAQDLPFQLSFLSGSSTSEAKEQALDQIRSGRAQLIVGTHSLFSTAVEFQNLTYVIVDEQHKFGVSQRQKLLDKGMVTDLLLMSATPIPRTAALTLLGNVPMSTLQEAPAGRVPIKTYLVEQTNMERVYSFVADELAAGHQAYFAHPVIEANEAADLGDIESAVTVLQNRFPKVQISVLHSRLKESEKQEIIQKFSEGQVAILIATSVVEVGVDVARATVMVIHHADRFGLASLHQLRGRVGRRSLSSYCFLVYTLPLGEDSKDRLKAIRESTDGFYLAQRDLELRGSGNFRGDKQSGRLILTIANLEKDQSIFWSIKEQIPSYFQENSPIPSQVRQFVLVYLQGKFKTQETLL